MKVLKSKPIIVTQQVRVLSDFYPTRVSECKFCTKIKSAKWYEENQERASLRGKEYRKTTEAKALHRRAYENWRSRHGAAHHVESVNRWRKENPERAREAGVSGIFDYNKWMERVEYFGWKCVYCCHPLTEKTLTIDHVKPISKGGSNWPSNLVPACKLCNSRKIDKYAI